MMMMIWKGEGKSYRMSKEEVRGVFKLLLGMRGTTKNLRIFGSPAENQTRFLPNTT